MLHIFGGDDGNEHSIPRRGLLRAAGAGLFLVSGGEALAQTPGSGRPTRQDKSPPEFPTPRGLHHMAQLDARFPIAYEESVPAAMNVITKWYAALVRRDLSEMSRYMHFPFGLYEGTDPIVVESAAAFVGSPPQTLNFTGRGKSEFMPGAYDLLDKLELQIFSPVAVGLSLSFTRYTPRGFKLAECEGIYAITNNDGRWGIELASTIYTPAEEIGQKYLDAVEADLRRGRDWMLGYTLRSQAVLNSTRRPGPSASIEVYGPRERAGNARVDNPMAGYRTRGIKSRLRVHDVTPEDIARADANFPEFATWAGGGVGQWEYTMNLPEARVLHATVNKAHTFGGYLRYTKDHVLISETRGLGVLVYKNSEWAPAGFMGNVMLHHDRTNSEGYPVAQPNAG